MPSSATFNTAVVAAALGGFAQQVAAQNVQCPGDDAGLFPVPLDATQLNMDSLFSKNGRQFQTYDKGLSNDRDLALVACASESDENDGDETDSDGDMLMSGIFVSPDCDSGKWPSYDAIATAVAMVTHQCSSNDGHAGGRYTGTAYTQKYSVEVRAVLPQDLEKIHDIPNCKAVNSSADKSKSVAVTTTGTDSPPPPAPVDAFSTTGSYYARPTPSSNNRLFNISNQYQYDAGSSTKSLPPVPTAKVLAPFSNSTHRASPQTTATSISAYSVEYFGPGSDSSQEDQQSQGSQAMPAPPPSAQYTGPSKSSTTPYLHTGPGPVIFKTTSMETIVVTSTVTKETIAFPTWTPTSTHSLHGGHAAFSNFTYTAPVFSATGYPEQVAPPPRHTFSHTGGFVGYEHGTSPETSSFDTSYYTKPTPALYPTVLLSSKTTPTASAASVYTPAGYGGAVYGGTNTEATAGAWYTAVPPSDQAQSYAGMAPMWTSSATSQLYPGTSTIDEQGAYPTSTTVPNETVIVTTTKDDEECDDDDE